jgi:hypothetical protein
MYQIKVFLFIFTFLLIISLFLPPLGIGSSSSQISVLGFARDWSCRTDMNSDGLFTVGDLRPLGSCIFYYPGDYTVYDMVKRGSPWAIFFELGPQSYGGRFSLAVSLLAWGILAIKVFVLWFLSIWMYYECRAWIYNVTD